MSRHVRLTVEDLIEYLRESIVPPSENRIGTEYELFCLEKESLARLAYDGSPGIGTLLEFMADRTGARPVKEEGRIIGLEHDDYNVSIEPGGQLEASFSPSRTMADLSEKLSRYLALLREAGSMGIVFIAVGVDPVNAFETVPWMPKRRYEIMRRYWERKPGLSHYMMKQTAAIQISIDYNSEEDAIRKLRNAVTLSDTLTSLFANSPVYERAYRFTGSFRKKIWCRTDKERSGAPAGCGRPIGSFADYVDYALDIPIIFLFRDGRCHDLDERVTFRTFLNEGYQGTFPDREDWLTHLNTIFSLVRFNNTTLEIRSFDSNHPALVPTIAAFVKGLFYADRVYEPLATPDDLLAIARENLPDEEAEYLAPLERILAEGRAPADYVREIFMRNGGISSLIDWLRIG